MKNINRPATSRKLTLKTLVAGATIAALSGVSRGQVLHLRREVHVPAGAIKLGEVASITGISDHMADRLARLMIVPKNSRVTGISAAQVLFALASRGHMRHLLSTLQVTGADRCRIIMAGQKAAAHRHASATLWANARVALASPIPQAAVPPAAVAPAAGLTGKKVVSKSVTLAGLLRKRILRRLHCTGSQVRMAYQTLNPILDQPLLPGQTWHFHLITGQYLGDVEFNAKLLANQQLVHQIFATVVVHKKIRAMVSSVLIRRGDVMTALDFKPRPRWIDRAMPTLFTSAKSLLGQQAVRTISPGAMLDQRDFKPVELVHRGETVTVHITSGAMHIKTTATARQAGGLNAVIALRNVNGKTFNATVTGRDQARLGSR